MNIKKCFLLQLICIILICSGLAAKNQVCMQVRVYYDTTGELEQIQLMGLDIVGIGENSLDLIVFNDDFEEIISNGFEIEVVHEDLTKFYQSRLDPTRDMGGYKTLAEIEAYIDEVIADHPDIVAAKVNIGLSLEGRPTWAIKISDNPDIDEEEPEIMYTSAIHAREIITPVILMATIDYLTDNYGIDGRATFLVENREMWFLLVLNPDGYYYNEVTAPEGGGMWRKNRRDNGDGSWGVDLNRNFGYQWGYNDLGSSPNGSDETYRGTGPFSEPETQNLRDFTIAHEFDITVHFHSFAQLVGWPWFYNAMYCADHSTFQRLGNMMILYNGYAIQGHTSMPGAWSINGSNEDWDYGEESLKNKNFAYVIETGNAQSDFWPPLESVPQLVAENQPICLLAASAAGRLDLSFENVPDVPVLYLDEIVESTEYQVAWTVEDDPENPIANYWLYEYPIEIAATDTGGHLFGYNSDLFIESETQYHSAPVSYYSRSVPNSIHYMRTVCPYTVQPGDTLEFQTFYDIQTRYDYAYVEISTDGINFIPIEGNITTNYNPNGLNRGNGITASSLEWIHAFFDMTDYMGQDIFIQFSFYTDASINNIGIYIDDIYPINMATDEILVSSNIAGNNYTFIEHPAGYYDYRVKSMDVDGQLSQFSVDKVTYARPPFICGDPNKDESINILDIVYVINYIYKNGPEPYPLESADVDGDTLINILDIVYLINYVYKNGPDPFCL